MYFQKLKWIIGPYTTLAYTRLPTTFSFTPLNCKDTHQRVRRSFLQKEETSPKSDLTSQ
jgi:hypothetical protein